MGMEQLFIESSKRAGYNEEAINSFTAAIDFANTELQDQRRISGEKIIDHALRVGIILVDNKAFPEAVLAGLLHDCPPEEIQSRYGPDVAAIVQGVHAIHAIKSKNKQLEAESLRKMVLTTLKDTRIILVKLANKLDNLYTIRALPEEDQQRIAREVLEVYTPLASRLGADKIKTQLEDLAFKILYPQEYQDIINFLEETSPQREQDITDAIKVISATIGDQVTILKIKGRPKHLYSIYRKMTQRKVSLREQYDLLGIRIIVPDVKDCYTVLGLLHEHFEPIEGRLKDYIATPKPNLYRSIHTGVRLPTGKIAEIQIRTPEMDEIAEEGIAAHWQYKGVKSEELFEKKMGWLKGILDMQKEENHEFLEAAKVDLFGDSIYCYTPKGAVKELPVHATVLDFAYLVHEEVGNHAIGARVNGIFVPLNHEVRQGDVIEIVTNKNQRPRRSWLKIVKSTRARQKIRKSLKEHEKLPALHYRSLKPALTEDQGVLLESAEFPAAVCLLAKCCWPLPGEEIAGIVTKRRVISVHQQACRLALKEQLRWVKVSWKSTFSQKIRFVVAAEERSGLLADLLHTIAKAGFEVKEAKGKLIDRHSAECSFLVIPRDLEQLKELVRRVQNVKGVKKIYFE